MVKAICWYGSIMFTQNASTLLTASHDTPQHSGQFFQFFVLGAGERVWDRD